MDVFPGSEQQREPGDLSPEPRSLEEFAELEGLHGEDLAVLAAIRRSRGRPRHGTRPRVRRTRANAPPRRRT